jgi:hypothetical protein
MPGARRRRAKSANQSPSGGSRSVRQGIPRAVVATLSCSQCARVTTFLPYPAREPLNHEFAQFTRENAVELICNEKQRNRENFNLKSVASIISRHRRSERDLSHVLSADQGGRGADHYSSILHQRFALSFKSTRPQVMLARAPSVDFTARCAP